MATHEVMLAPKSLFFSVEADTQKNQQSAAQREINAIKVFLLIQGVSHLVISAVVEITEPSCAVRQAY